MGEEYMTSNVSFDNCLDYFKAALWKYWVEEEDLRIDC